MLKNIINETDLIKRLDITKDQLNILRRDRNFPYIQVTKSCRVYHEKEVMEWLIQNGVNSGFAVQLTLPKKQTKSS